MNILICGHRAFAARNLKERLKQIGHTVICFSRGEEKREGDTVTGLITQIDTNPLLLEEIDVVINFILLKKESFEDNLAYIEALCRFCKKKKIKKLIHISSISVYPNEAELITEETEIDHNYRLKGGYGAQKILIDEYLIKQRDEKGLPLILLRPGFITASDHPNPIGGIAKMLPIGFTLLIGNRESTLPIVSRDEMQYGLLKVIEDIHPLPVYLLIRESKGTKANYVKTLFPDTILISLPESIVVGLSQTLKILHIFDERKFQMVKGVFKINKFNAEKTYNKIGKRL
ncbi:NAD-dependent epimerase/dehydratase family protein [Bacteroides fluxus]|jgi:nucleoside-diphosphate-sugar epimerase|uniref:NAD-dependent epimerase/dehydratase family protein n=1 Tax=Bacteroides fluxus TaxID=626930 RepID=UPI002355404A|nr:NAD-dependent epimerase/dehydratase family protein [Bacteroides fluxus]